jgi:hypothetical protein
MTGEKLAVTGAQKAVIARTVVLVWNFREKKN